MSEVTLATLAMEVSVPTADAAIDKLTKLRNAASDLEGQAGKTATASKEQASAHGYMGTAAAQAEKTMRGLVEVYGTAFNASGRYVHSVDAEVSMILQNAKATAALAREQDSAARAVQRLTSAYDPLSGEVLKTNRQLAEAQKLFDKGAISASQYGAVTEGLKQKLANLETAQASGVKSSKALQFATLNLGRQFADIGTQLAGGQSPFLILVQQGPQIADAFATATAGGLTFKAVIAGLVAEAKALAVTFGPWIAAFAAIGGAVFVATKAISDHEKKVKDLYKAIDEQNKKLSESAPWLIKNSDNAYLAAEGQKNFEKYLAKTNGTLETQIKLLRAAAIEGLKKDLTEAQSNQKKAKTEFERVSSANGRGSSPAGFTTNVGGFTTVSAAPTRAAIERTDGYKKALAEATKAADNVRIAQEKLNAALKVTPADYGAAFAGQASQAEKLAGAIDTLLPKEKQIRDVRQQRAIVEQALAKGQISAAQAARAIAEAEKQIAEINRDPAAERALKAEQRKERAEAKKELAELVKAYEEPLKASEVFADALAKEVAVMGLSNEQQKRREIAMQAAAAPTAALAAQIAELGAQWEAQTKVTKEWTDIQAGVKAAANDNIKTFDEQTKGLIHFSTKLEIAAADAEEAARAAREFRYDLEDVAWAINNNDWVSAFAGLVSVLAKVETAFKTATTAKEKYSAVAMLAQGVGGAVGGTGGAIIGGAGSGALAGLGVASSLTTLGLAVPGPGWALAAGGAILGGLGGLFGSSKAKKQAKRQAEAQRAAEEAARQQQIADITYNINLSILQAQGKATEALAMQREHELAALAKLDPALVDLQKQLYAASDAAAIAARRSEIQDEIDKLTMSSADLLAKARGKERAEAVALDPTLGDLIDKLYGLQDATSAAAEAAATMSSEITEYYAREAGAARHAERMQAEEAARQEEIRGQGLLRGEIYAAERAAAEETAKAWEELVGKVNEGRQALLRAGDLLGALAGENSVRQGIGFGGANFDAGGFNIAYAAQQSRIAQDLLAKVSSDALNTENVSKVIGDLSRVIQPDVLRQSFESGVRAGLLDGIGAGAGADRIADALSGVVNALAAKDLNSSYSTDMGGFSSVLAARAAVDRAGQYGSFGARSFMGGDITAYQEALLKLDRELDRGGITLEDYARATTNLRNAMGSTMDIVDSFTAQQGRLEAALVDLGRAGLSSIDYYFGEITKSADALAIAAAKAEDPISAVTQAIGRLTSIGDVFGQSALAAFDGGFATDAVSKSALIAQSAAIAAQVVTSADAARVAKQIATDAAFAATDAAGIRDASLLLDGVKAFDPKGFEDAFLRLNNALVKGAVTDDQYSTLFANALATYQGLDDQVSATSGVFADLRKTAKALADQLAITEAANPSMGLAEAQRQYDAILARAVGGDANAVSGLNAAVSALVDAGKAGFGTSDEQAGLVARVVSDLRQAELAQPVNPHVEANAPLLVELQALRKEVAAFRAENRATGEKTALNTSDMRRIAEDTQVNGQLVVTV